MWWVDLYLHFLLYEDKSKFLVAAYPSCQNVYHCFTQHSPRVCPRVVVSWDTVLPLISALTVKIRAARNCISQLCPWLWVNRWSFCQFLAAALLISHFLVFCTLVKESWIGLWLDHNYGRGFFLFRIFLLNFSQGYRTSNTALKSSERETKGEWRV